MLSLRIVVPIVFASVILGGWRGGLTSDSFRMAVAQEPNETISNLKLPTFHSDRPRFCLLNLPSGNGNSQSCLIAVDDSTLFIDLNFNRDLTEESERIVAKNKQGLSESDSEFEVPVVEAGNRRHREFVLTVSPLKRRDKNDIRIKTILEQDPAAESYELSLEIDTSQFHGIGAGGNIPVSAGFEDLNGVLQFSSDPAKAPLINFAGEFEVRPDNIVKLRSGSSTEVTFLVGTSGKGPGTFAAYSYHGVVPDTVFPRLTLESRNSENGSKLVSATDITQRC